MNTIASHAGVYTPDVDANLTCSRTNTPPLARRSGLSTIPAESGVGVLLIDQI